MSFLRRFPPCSLLFFATFGAACGSSTPIDTPANDSGSDAADASNPCTSLPAASTPITTECPAGSTDAPSGGTIADGTYALTHQYVWSSACGGYTTTLSDALRIQAGNFEERTNVVSFTGPAGGETGLFGTSGSFTVAGSAITVGSKCTTARPFVAPFTTAVSFTATASELRLFDASTPPHLLAVYARI